MGVLSGQITVAAAGTAVAGPATPLGSYFVVKAHPDNVGTVWFGNDGANDVTSGNGFPLDPGEAIEVYTTKLSALYFDAENNGDKFCWYRVE